MVAGTLTTELGAIDSARIGFLQDATGGDRDPPRRCAPDRRSRPVRRSRSSGTLGSYFSLRTLNVVAAAVAIDGDGGAADAARSDDRRARRSRSRALRITIGGAR